MTHQEVWANEQAQLADTAWERWIHRAEALVGHSLDGDQTTDGYSYDFAYDAFKRGVTAKDYVNAVAK